MTGLSNLTITGEAEVGRPVHFNSHCCDGTKGWVGLGLVGGGFYLVASVGFERGITMEVFVVEGDRRDSLEWVVSASGVGRQAGRQTDRQALDNWTRANCEQVTDEAAFEFEVLWVGSKLDG